MKFDIIILIVQDSLATRLFSRRTLKNRLFKRDSLGRWLGHS
jgi:hypothetical protein